MSGGFSNEAEKDNIYIKYPDGNSVKYHPLFRNSKVLDGSIISVGRKKEEEPFDSTEYMKELSAIFANLAQAIAVIALASR